MTRHGHQVRTKRERERSAGWPHTQGKTGALPCDKQYGWSSCLRTATVVIVTIWPRWPETEPVTHRNICRSAASCGASRGDVHSIEDITPTALLKLLSSCTRHCLMHAMQCQRISRGCSMLYSDQCLGRKCYPRFISQHYKSTKYL